MSGAATIAARIEAERLLAIVRTSEARAGRAAAQAVLAGGITVIEISLTTPDALAVVRDVAEAGHALVGVGTVRSVADAEAAVAVGARFLLSPHVDLSVAAWARANDVLYLPGALTPTDVAAALDAGCRLVKLFPARAFGPAHVRDLLGPFPGARLVPTGGVDLGNAADYLAAGAAAVALGGSLVNDATAADPDRLTALSANARAAIPSTNPTTEST
jgi:2-dehydro-3-deoxyphosphogluconate aldolase/(4S)-4-hydroxy-2-oxoglutarate aldolase